MQSSPLYPLTRLCDYQNSFNGHIFAASRTPSPTRGQEYDGMLSDAFSLGVTIYAVLLKDGLRDASPAGHARGLV